MNFSLAVQQRSNSAVKLGKVLFFNNKNNYSNALLLCCFTAALLLCSFVAEAATITADQLEYFSKEHKYVATGNVKIEKEDTVLTADKVIFYHNTSYAEAEGHVTYEDTEAKINTEKAEINIDAKTGRLFNAVIFFKKGNYWINGDNISRIKEDHYYASSATFTTCDTEQSANPDWCFKGDDVDIIVGKRLTAKDVTFRVKGMPVLYSPYLWAPVLTQRQTGFLFPVIGTSNAKGFQFSPSFFWAIDDNKDATFYLNYYSKRGMGIGIEYRYIDDNGKGNWYAYHIRDRELKENFFEIKGFSEYRLNHLKGHIDVNFINREEFYKEYSVRQEIRIQRFLQSTAEVSLPMTNSRLYLLGQYWLDLRDEDDLIPQRLPELGYVINPGNIGPFVFNMHSSIANFVREKGVDGQRLDINPTISYSFGEKISLFQSLSLRGTAYNLKDADPLDSFFHRETFEYRAHALTRYVRKYDAFTHIIEPSVEYRFIPATSQVPMFDSVDTFDRTSQIQFSLLNRVALKNLTAYIRLAQPYDFDAVDSQFMPTKLEAFIAGPFTLRFDASYDFNKGRLEVLDSEIRIKIADKTNISIGERYNKEERLMLYKAALDTELSRSWAINADVWYDAKSGGLRDAAVKTTYTSQCWALRLIFSRKPGDDIRSPEYSFMFLVELKGVGLFKVI